MKKERHLVYKIYRKKTIERVESKIKLLGIYCKYDVMQLLNLRLITSIILFLILLFVSDYGYLIAPVGVILFYILSEKVVLDYPITKRVKKLEDEAAFFFEVLGLTLESGRNLKSALDMTSKNIDSELSQEFRKTLSEIKLGKSFTESLVSMKERIPSDTINNIILSLTQSSIYGSSISESLTNQLDYLREKKLLEVKGEIAKLPTKISVISVIFFIPIMLLVILSPVIIEFFSK